MSYYKTGYRNPDSILETEIQRLDKIKLNKNEYQPVNFNSISSNIIPSTDSFYTLGNVTNKYDDIYVNTIHYTSLTPSINSSQWTTSGTNIHYNSGSVGIGTATPIAKIDISQTTRVGTHATHNPALYITGELGEANNGVEIRHTNGTQGIGIGYNSIYATSSGDQNINIIPKGNGRVGIGTTNPGAKLTIDDPNASNGLHISVGLNNDNAELMTIDQWNGGRRLTVTPQQMSFTGSFSCSSVSTNAITIPSLTSATTNNVVYYDTSSFSLSYGAPFAGTNYNGTLTFTGPRTIDMTYTAVVIGKLVTISFGGSGISAFNPTTQASIFTSGVNSLPSVLRPNSILSPHTCVFSGKQNTSEKLYQFFIYNNGEVRIMTADTTSFITTSSYFFNRCSTSYEKV